MPRCQEKKVVSSLITTVEKSNLHKRKMELNLIGSYYKTENIKLFKN